MNRQKVIVSKTVTFWLNTQEINKIKEYKREKLWFSMRLSKMHRMYGKEEKIILQTTSFKVRAFLFF